MGAKWLSSLIQMACLLNFTNRSTQSSVSSLKPEDILFAKLDTEIRNKKEENMEEKRYSGLTNEQVQSRIREGKQNRVTITAEKSTREIIYSNVFTYFNLVFGILAILLILVRSWNNMLFVPIVVVNSLIGIVQELRSRRILNKMRLLQVEKARVIREGERLDFPVDQVVEGDVVLFQSGDQIYADAKVLDGSIMVDESQLTGEADEIPKGENQKLMSGSFVISGQAVAVLEQVGDASYINQLSLSAKKVKGHEESEMVHAVDGLVRMIGMILIPIGLLLFVQKPVAIAKAT